MHSCELDIGRCACIHGKFQAVDAIIQCILYQRGVVPAPVGQILAFPETVHEKKFAESYNKMRGALREVFRSYNRTSLRQVLVLIGNSSLLPKELYRIELDLCGINGPDTCHPNCSELTDKELRKVSSGLLFDMFNSSYEALNFAKPQVYLFLRGSSSLRVPVDLVEEDDSFELPSEKIMEHKKIKTYCFSLKHHCKSSDIQNLNVPEEALVWFRLYSNFKMFAN